jgi:FecR protein
MDLNFGSVGWGLLCWLCEKKKRSRIFTRARYIDKFDYINFLMRYFFINRSAKDFTPEAKLMIARLIQLSVLMFCVLMLTCSTAAVGRLTLVEGRVELLKDGNLPAMAVKIDDSLGAGDVIRTKSMSRAQITFIDNSTLTISPESRIAIAEFKFDAAQKKRSAVLEIFRGLALAVVSNIIKVEEPDFVIKTHTAIVGVRGTEFGIRLSPNFAG